MEPCFQQLLLALLLMLVSVVGYGLKKGFDVLTAYANVKIGVETTGMLKTFAQTVVRSLEQNGAFKGLIGADKKELAIVAITQYADEHGIPVDRTFIDKIIEEAVQIMNENAPLIGEIISGLEGG